MFEIWLYSRHEHSPMGTAPAFVSAPSALIDAHDHQISIVTSIDDEDLYAFQNRSARPALAPRHYDALGHLPLDWPRSFRKSAKTASPSKDSLASPSAIRRSNSPGSNSNASSANGRRSSGLTQSSLLSVFICAPSVAKTNSLSPHPSPA